MADRIESGESFVTAETLFNICSVLEISPKHLFDFEVLQNVLTNNNEMAFSVRQDSNYNKLLEKLNKIKNDKNKLEYLNLSFDSLTNKKSLEKLKDIIKGIEISLN